jgi:hypothetical protein
VDGGQGYVDIWKNKDGKARLVLWPYDPTKPNVLELMSIEQAGRLIVLEPLMAGGKYDLSTYGSAGVEQAFRYVLEYGTNIYLPKIIQNPQGTVIIVIGIEEDLPDRYYWEGTFKEIKIFMTYGYYADIRGDDIAICATIQPGYSIAQNKIYQTWEEGKYIGAHIINALGACAQKK